MSLIGKFASVGGATMASRVLGFVREAMIAALLGAGPVADAFYAAFRFPNLFRRILAEGAFNAAFVPLFSKELEQNGTAAAREFAEQVLSFLILVLLALSALAMVFMPLLVGTIIAPKFAEQPEKFELTVLLTRIMFPYLAAMSLVAMLAGVLNAFRRYFLAALAPVLLNVVLVGVLLWAAYNNLESETLGVFLACGVVGSGAVQLALLVYGVVRQGFPLSLRMPRLTDKVKRVLMLALPTAIAGGITQVNLLVGPDNSLCAGRSNFDHQLCRPPDAVAAWHNWHINWRGFVAGTYTGAGSCKIRQKRNRYKTEAWSLVLA